MSQYMRQDLQWYLCSFDETKLRKPEIQAERLSSSASSNITLKQRNQERSIQKRNILLDNLTGKNSTYTGKYLFKIRAVKMRKRKIDVIPYVFCMFEDRQTCYGHNFQRKELTSILRKEEHYGNFCSMAKPRNRKGKRMYANRYLV